ncbi:HAD family phosphatase [candidate division WWE3 bacterium]|uniref:HAD family phosphatase n=1 Tax=candidate division WWE3 bacterium TaxID=2053526 RepID=A0A955LHJ8_UNCKA|nr:HAD family phosphatase [candidate division WWE3 bacterium]
MQKYSLAIFDLNGTVLDDEPVWSKAFIRLFEEYGVRDQYFYHQPGIGITGNWKIYQAKIPAFQSLSTEEVRPKILSYYGALLPSEVKYRNGVERFIEAIKTDGIHCILATSLDRDILDGITQAMPDLTKKFEMITTGDEVAAKKPAPDIFLLAFDRFNQHADVKVEKNQAIIFEDSLAGIKAAEAAGIPAIYLPNADIESGASSTYPLLVASDFTDKQLFDMVISGGD